MAAEVEEQAGAGDLAVPAPGRPRLTDRSDPRQGEAHHGRRAEAAALDKVAHELEARQGPAVVRHVEGDAGRPAGRQHLLALGRRSRHGLLDVDGLAGLGRELRVLRVAGGRGGHVDGVHVVRFHHGAGVRRPPLHAVARRVVAGLLGVTAHDHGHGAAGHARERGPRLDLRDVASADEAPAHLLGRPVSYGFDRRGVFRHYLGPPAACPLTMPSPPASRSTLGGTARCSPSGRGSRDRGQGAPRGRGSAAGVPGRRCRSSRRSSS